MLKSWWVALVVSARNCCVWLKNKRDRFKKQLHDLNQMYLNLERMPYAPFNTRRQTLAISQKSRSDHHSEPSLTCWASGRLRYLRHLCKRVILCSGKLPLTACAGSMWDTFRSYGNPICICEIVLLQRICVWDIIPWWLVRDTFVSYEVYVIDD